MPEHSTEAKRVLGRGSQLIAPPLVDNQVGAVDQDEEVWFFFFFKPCFRFLT